MNIVVGFSTTRKWKPLSWAIKLVEKTPYSHTYLRFSSSNLDRDFIYQASDDSLNFMNMQTFSHKNIIIEEFVIPVTAEEKRAIMQYCIDKNGVPYGMLQIVGMGIVRLTKLWFGRSIHNPFRGDDKTQVCLELVGRALGKLGAPMTEQDLNEGRLTWIHDLAKGLTTRVV